MDKIKNYIIISLIFLILTGFCGLFVYLYIKERNKPPYEVISTVTVTKIDTLKYTDTLMYPVPVHVLQPVYDTIIDTVFVIQDYYSGKIYEYNYKDSNLCIKSNIIIHKNKLISLFNEYEIYRKTITTTNTIEVISRLNLRCQLRRWRLLIHQDLGRYSSLQPRYSDKIVFMSLDMTHLIKPLK